MTQETIRMIEEARKLSDSEWEERKKERLKQVEATKIERKIYNILKEIGVPANIKGYRYIKEAIMLAIYKPTILDGITKELYPTLAKNFKATPSRVERDMRHAIEVAFDEGNTEKIYEVFKSIYSPEKGKVSNSQFVAGISEYIRNS